VLEHLITDARGFTRELLAETERLLSAVPRRLEFQHSVFDRGEVHVDVFAPEIAREVEAGDYVYAGFTLAHDPGVYTEAGVRIYRVACRNGVFVDSADGQRLAFEGGRPPFRWKAKLGRVVAQSFDGGCLGEETRRLRRALREILPTPYEFLLNLRAQGLITDEEQEAIQREFRRADDATVYGLVNAVTRIAHLHRERSDWRRALLMERLGGEIARGDHEPPVGSPVFQ
jgi:hypothetical protein